MQQEPAKNNAAHNGIAESDSLHKLVIDSSLPWRNNLTDHSHF